MSIRNSREKKRRSTLDIFLNNLKTKPCVIGVVLLGSLGEKGVIDKYSDIDIAVFVDAVSKVAWLPTFEFTVVLNEPDTFGQVLNFNVHQQLFKGEIDAPWDEVKIEAYKRGKIVFDKKGKIKKLIEFKMRSTNELWHTKLTTLSTKTPPYLKINPLKQARRGHFLQAHSILNQGIDVLIDTVFALNREFTPHNKWKLVRSFDLRWKPKNYRSALTEGLLVKSFTLKDVSRRIDVLESITNEVNFEIEKILMKTISESYIEACSTVLGRQLNHITFSKKFEENLKKKCSKKDRQIISGFINYHLIENDKGLKKLLSSQSYNENVQGAQKCRESFVN